MFVFCGMHIAHSQYGQNEQYGWIAQVFYLALVCAVYKILLPPLKSG
jgi:hypothetical protein